MSVALNAQALKDSDVFVISQLEKLILKVIPMILY